MSDLNVCADLVITKTNFERPFYEMYMAQKRLQLRLDSINTSKDTDAKEVSVKCTYWHFCICAELKELLEWRATSEPFDVKLKEMRMEAIDVLHFVFNIALELCTDEFKVEELITNIPMTSTVVVIDNELDSIAMSVLNATTELVDHLPWKTWKTYAPTTIGVATESMDLFIEKMLAYSFRLCYSLGLNKQAIVDYYFSKNSENHRRQDDGY